MRFGEVCDLEREAGLPQAAGTGCDQPDRFVALEYREEVLLGFDRHVGRGGVLMQVLLAAVVG